MTFWKKRGSVGTSVHKECKRHYKHVSNARKYKNLGGHECIDETGVSVTHELDDNTVWVRDLSAFSRGCVMLKSRQDVVALKEFLVDILEEWT